MPKQVKDEHDVRTTDGFIGCVGTLPSTKEARNQAAVPVAAILQPLAPLAPGEETCEKRHF